MVCSLGVVVIGHRWHQADMFRNSFVHVGTPAVVLSVPTLAILEDAVCVQTVRQHAIFDFDIIVKGASCFRNDSPPSEAKIEVSTEVHAHCDYSKHGPVRDETQVSICFCIAEATFQDKVDMIVWHRQLREAAYLYFGVVLSVCGFVQHEFSSVKCYRVAEFKS